MVLKDCPCIPFLYFQLENLTPDQNNFLRYAVIVLIKERRQGGMAY